MFGPQNNKKKTTKNKRSIEWITMDKKDFRIHKNKNEIKQNLIRFVYL